MKRACLTIGFALCLAACGQVAPLRPAPGRAMPVKPLMANATPSVDDLLSLPPQAKPRRVDELLTRSQPREPDRFDLPPADGGAAPTQLQGEEPKPSTTGPDTAGEPQ